MLSNREVLFPLACFVISGSGLWAQQYTISTMAGTGLSGYSGDGGPAIKAALRNPSGVAVDAVGNIYISDFNNYRVRKISDGRIITTIAGNGERLGPVASEAKKYSGDGWLATTARLAGPNRLAVDRAGNVYFADTENHRVRKVSPDGNITTVAGTGFTDFRPLGGRPTDASISAPVGVTLDEIGNLYVADWDEGRILQVAAAGVITAVASTRTDSRQIGMQPAGIAVDSQKNIYFTVPNSNYIRKVTSGGIIATIVGGSTAGFSGDGGPAASALLSHPFDVAIDSVGNVYIADTYNNRIRKVSANGIITTIAGNGNAGYSGDGGPATRAQLNKPVGIAVDQGGNVYVADSGNNAIRLLRPSRASR